MKLLNLVVCLTLTWSSYTIAEMQEWKSKGGHSFTGEFVKMDLVAVFLRGEDGKEVRVPLAALDPASVELAKAEAAEAEKNKPLFSHKTPKVEVEVVANQGKDVIGLRLMHAGKPLPLYGDLRLGLHLSEIRRKGNEKAKYVKIELAEVVPKTIGRGKAVVILRFKNEAEVELTVDGLNDGIKVSFDILDPPADLPPLDAGMSMEMPKFLTYDVDSKSYKGELAPQGVPELELESLLTGYEMTYSREGEEKVTLPFFKYPAPLSADEITFLLGNPRTKFELEANDAGRLSAHFYGDKLLVEGFQLRFKSVGQHVKGAPEFSIRAP